MNAELALDPRTVKTLSGAFKHPALGAKAEWVSLEWLLAISNPEPAPSVPLPGSKGFESPQALAEDIMRSGLSEPAIISVGTASCEMRLETGSRRVAALLEAGFLFMPAVCSVSEVCGVSESNGRHPGKPVRLWPDVVTRASLGIYAERRLASPSETIPSCPCIPRDPAAAKPDQKKAAKKAPAKKREAPPAQP